MTRDLPTMLLLCALLAGCSPKAERAKDGVRALLRDPSSAQFRGVYVQKTGVVCGEVNARNAYGGYVGFRPFVADPEGRVVVGPEDPDDPAVGDGFPSDVVMGRKFADLIFSRHCVPRDTGGWG